MNILYIDDETDILDLAEIYFGEQEFNITTAMSATEALPLIKESYFDVIISDAQMPFSSGIELFENLQEQKLRYGSFILVSGHYDLAEKESLPSGILMVMTKPIDFDELIAKIRSLPQSK
jgi:DNA-binding response OmpR family regulator